MKYTVRDRCIALAGLFQTCALVQQIATRGTANSAIIEVSIESLFRFDVNSTEEVFGNIASIKTGLRTLKEQLTSTRSDRDPEITRYAISLLALERSLNKNKTMLDTIAKRLRETENSLEYFGLDHENVFARLGGIYKDTISTLGPRIIVSGERPYLDNEHNANKVRALLLAGIRAAVLWRQCGGSRWQILFGRKQYITACHQLLSEA